MRAYVSRAVVSLAVLSGVLVVSPSGPWSGAGEAQAAGTTYIVTTTADSGAGSLRQAILDAETTLDDDTITFDPTVFTSGALHTITLVSTLPTVTKPLSIIGPGQNVLAISGDDTVRVMSVNGNRPNNWSPYPYPQGVPVTITDLTLTRGRPPMADANPYVKLGGALSLGMAKLTMERVTVSHSLGWLGGGIAVTHSSLTMRDSRVENNTATGAGGGIYSDWADLGEAYAYLDIRNTTFTGNTSPRGGAITGHRTVHVTDSTFTSNTSSGDGGAVWLGYSFNHTITNSTITGNTAARGGGIVAGGAGWYKGMLTLSGSTVAGNTATAGDGSGGIWIGSSILRILNSNLSNGAAGNCKGTWSVTGSGAVVYSNLISTAGSTFSDNSCNQFDRASLLTGWSAATAGATSILQTVGDPPFLVGDTVRFCGPNNCNASNTRSGVVTSVSAADDTIAVTVNANVSATAYAANLYAAAWVDLPKIESVTPASGVAGGGDVVTIRGAGFGNPGASPTIEATFGGVAAAGITHVDDTTLVVTTPPGAGLASVTVSGNANTSVLASNTLVGAFTYPGGASAPVISGISPSRGSVGGGTPVIITGTHLTGATAVTFGGVPATFSVSGGTTITATTPAGVVGPVDVAVTTGAGTSTSPGGFTYEADPAVVPAPEARPAGAPRDVRVTVGDSSAVASWQAPADSGSFGITHYQAVASPSGAMCLASAPELSCTLAGLSNGTTYTLVVRALTGAGWGLPSEASVGFIPAEVSAPAVIAISGKRGLVKGRVKVVISGTATGLAPGTVLKPWLRFQGRAAYAPGNAKVVVGASGEFTWSRKTRKTINVYLEEVVGGARSNAVRLLAPAPAGR